MASKIRKIAILGFGREGQAVLKFIEKSPAFGGAEIWILDKSAATRIPTGVKSQLGKDYLRNLGDFDLIFRSPGIPYNLPELKNARRKGIKFSSLMRSFMENCPAKIIGITGSKGKTTTSTLLYKILKVAGRKVFLAGNIGTAALSILNKVDKNSFVVLELSSFQLQDLDISPNIAAVLDVFPEHQDYHHSLNEYYNAKANIVKYQSADRRTGDRVFFFENGGLGRSTALKSPALKIPVDEKGFDLFKYTDLKIPGAHSFKNAVMAATIARSFGVPAQTIRRVVKNFRGVPHRLELVRKVMVRSIRRTQDAQAHHKWFDASHRGNKSTIYFYNDSASTNPQTTAAAIEAFPSENKILIAGGQDKGLDYKPLADALKSASQSIKLVILFGENKNKIYKTIKKSGVKIRFASNLGAAIKSAYTATKKILPTTYYLLPTAIIFSPGAASFDMFKNYADRGEKFKKIVAGLTHNK